MALLAQRREWALLAQRREWAKTGVGADSRRRSRHFACLRRRSRHSPLAIRLWPFAGG
jgi:hypothetical protein